MSEPLIEQLKTGTCSFTGKTYNCERCEVKPKYEKGPHVLHMSFCITGFVNGILGKRELKRTAKAFVKADGTPPTPEELLEYFKELYKLGAKVIPMSDNCKNFCFKYGCMGEKYGGKGGEE